MKNFDVKGSLTFKILFTGFLAMVLMIPLGMVDSVIRERLNRRNEAVNEVSSKWGHQQTIAGPVLVVPYRFSYTEEHDGKKITHTIIKNACFLPESLRIKGRLSPEKRSRGLYEVILYSLKDLSISGTFTRPDPSRLNIAADAMLWERAYLALGIPDTRGIQKGIKLVWNGKEVSFLPGVKDAGVVASGIHAPVPGLRGNRAGSIDYAMNIDLRGSSTLNFSPMGKDTTVELDSSWPHPSFTGAYLPDRHRVGDDGFTAKWNVSYFGRNMPQEFIQGEIHNPGETPAPNPAGASSFGVRLYVPVDFYQKCERAVKYGFLFITLTFLAFFLFELFNKLTIHPLQYMMVGFAMSIFYLLFLALSEHLGFFLSYGAASLAVMALITGYCVKVLKTRKRAGYMFGLLFGLYSFLYVLLENEDYALLLGTLALFAILAAVMYLTRNVDWYRIRLGNGAVAEETGSAELV
jgi:inner membrane protein